MTAFPIFAARRRRGGGGGGGVPPSLPVNVTPPTLVLLNDTTLQYTRGVWTGTEPITFEAELEINGSFVRVVEPGPIAIEGPWLGGTATIWETATNDQGSGNVGAGPLQLPALPPLAAALLSVSRNIFSSSFDVLLSGGTPPIVLSTDESGSFVDQETVQNSRLPFPINISRLGLNNSITSLTARLRDSLGASVDIPVDIELAPADGAWPALLASGGGTSPTSRTINFSGGTSVDPSTMKFRVTLTGGPVSIVSIADVPVPVGTTREQAASLCLAAIQAAAASISGLSARIDAGDPTTVIVEGASPVTAISAQAFLVAQQPAPDPEDALVSWLAGRVGYGVDPNDLGSLFRDTAGTLPVTTDGQPVALARSKFDPVSPAVADFLQATVALQPAYQAGSIDPDGVDDILPYNYGATGVLPIFQGLNGFVASVLVEMVSLATNQVVWVSGFGGTAANFRHRIRVTTAGAIQFSAQDVQNGAPVSVLSATGLITVGAKALITLAVDHDAKVLKGYLNGVEVASLALPNNVSPFNYDINRVRFFAQHGNTATELFGGKLYRAFFFHEKVDAAGRQIIENWVGEFAA